MEKPAEKETPKEAAKPIGQKPAPAAAAPATSPTKTEPAPKSYEVQVGVFTDMENAKQLQAKLAEHGIPSHTETKLQVGPFATRAEAEAAREKLKALGIGAVVVPGK
jgi:DedD protein